MIDFDRLIDAHLHREKHERQLGRYWPSEAGSCLRKTWFSFKQPKETPVETLRMFEVGNLVHDFVAEVLRSQRTPEIELLKSELPITLEEQGMVVSGRVDDVVLVRAKGTTYLVEVKSTKFLSYQKEPNKSHVLQLMIYMKATGVHNGIILYVEKSTLKTKNFEIPYDEALVQDALKRFKSIDAALKEDRMPEPEAKQSEEMAWMCNYCDWKEECGKLEE